jgi:hypothetical protein
MFLFSIAEKCFAIQSLVKMINNYVILFALSLRVAASDTPARAKKPANIRTFWELTIFGSFFMLFLARFHPFAHRLLNVFKARRGRLTSTLGGVAPFVFYYFIKVLYCKT